MRSRRDLFFNPRAISKPKNRRYPLSILALAAMIEGQEDYAIVDGNLENDPQVAIERAMREQPARLLAVSVMPGPQMVAAFPVCAWFKKTYPTIPIVWGGYFPSLYPDTALNAKYVDFAVRGQGEDTFVELLSRWRVSGLFPPFADCPIAIHSDCTCTIRSVR